MINTLKTPLIQNVGTRRSLSLNGAFRTIVDPYENGYYDYRYQLQTSEGYFQNRKPTSKTDRVEYDFDRSETLRVPGDWNSQRDELFFYEGTIWYKTTFALELEPSRRLFVYFAGANYEAKVYVNGVLVGGHVGGFTPFNFEVTDQVRSGENVLIVKVDNRRRREGVPTLNTDWWNYGGLTRDVWLLDVPATFIRDYSLKLASRDADRITGWVQLDGAELAQRVTLRIPEAAIEVTTEADAQGFAKFDVPASLELWCCERPKLYAVEFSVQGERIEDRIGFRTLETRGHDILLNGVSVFLRGISLHEQAPRREGRAVTRGDAETLLGWAQELDVNFVRLAHYPHHEHTARLADELGLLLWAEIPVYWTIDWENPETLANAKNQLEELVVRDKNRASVVIWSVGNETPIGDARNRFMAELVASVRALDDSRLVSAALERRQVEPGIELIDDPLGALLDVVGCNEYLGWYDGLPDKADSVSFQTAYDKPLVISEFGADALYGYHADALTRWSEEYQANVYTHQIAMLERIPFLRGVTPWILTDFRSPRRPLPQIQDFWNRKGLISDAGQKKQAFFVLKEYYQRLIARFRG